MKPTNVILSNNGTLEEDSNILRKAIRDSKPIQIPEINKQPQTTTLSKCIYFDFTSMKKMLGDPNRQHKKPTRLFCRNR